MAIVLPTSWNTPQDLLDYAGVVIAPANLSVLSEEDLVKYLNTSNLILKNDPSLSFPDTPSTKMQYAEAELVFELLSGNYLDLQNNIKGNVTSIGLGTSSLAFNSIGELQKKLYQEYPVRIENLISPYRINYSFGGAYGYNS